MGSFANVQLGKFLWIVLVTGVLVISEGQGKAVYGHCSGWPVHCDGIQNPTPPRWTPGRESAPREAPSEPSWKTQARALYNQGISLFSSHQYEASLDKFRQAAQLDPSKTYFVYYTEAAIAFKSSNFHLAITKLHDAIRYSDEPSAREFLGLAQQAAAEQDAIDLNTEGNRLYAAGRYNEAIASYREGLAKAPTQSEVYSHLKRNLALAQDQSEKQVARVETETRISQSVDTLAVQVARQERPQSTLQFVVDPRSFVTPELYKSALTDRERLTKLQQSLETKIGELQGWRSDTVRYRREFEGIRADAARGALSDTLAAIPAVEIAKGMATVPKYSKYITPSVVAKLETAYRALRGLLSGAEALGAREDAERFKAVAECQLELRKALLVMPLSELPDADEGKRWLKGMEKLLDVGVKVSAFGLREKNQAKGKEEQVPSLLAAIEPLANVSAEIGAVFYPPLGVGLAVKNLGEREAKARIARAAMDDLGDALSKNWVAEQHLRQKIERTQGFIAEQDRTIQSYEELHPEGKATKVR